MFMLFCFWSLRLFTLNQSSYTTYLELLSNTTINSPYQYSIVIPTQVPGRRSLMLIIDRQYKNNRQQCCSPQFPNVFMFSSRMAGAAVLILTSRDTVSCCSGATFWSKRPFSATAAEGLVARSATRIFELDDYYTRYHTSTRTYLFSFFFSSVLHTRKCSWCYLLVTG